MGPIGDTSTLLRLYLDKFQAIESHEDNTRNQDNQANEKKSIPDIDSFAIRSNMNNIKSEKRNNEEESNDQVTEELQLIKIVLVTDALVAFEPSHECHREQVDRIRA